MVRSIDAHANGVVDVTVSLTTPGCPIRSHFQTGVANAVRALDGVAGVNVELRRADRPGEGRAPAEARPRRRAADRRARAGRQRDLRRLGQGRRRQVVGDGEPRRRAGGRGQARRRARRGRVGLLAAAHVRPRRHAPEGQRAAQDRPAGGARRHQGDVDRLLHGGGRGRRVARADAAQGAHAVPRGRRLGRARLPARRPAARHRRRLDDARAAAAAGEIPDRHDAAAGRAEGRAPLGRDGAQGETGDRRHRREHVRLRDARAASATRSSARAAASCWPTSSTCRCSARCR